MFSENSHRLYFGDNLEIMKRFDSNIVDLVYINPPFNTGKTQSSHDLKYEDKFESRQDFLDFLTQRIIELKRILKLNGSFFSTYRSKRVTLLQDTLGRFIWRKMFYERNYLGI